jgi:hypothetical protein
MPATSANLGELLAKLIRQCAVEGDAVHLDGIGEFVGDDRNGLRFIAETAPSVFIAYVTEDSANAMRLYDELEAAGLRPWMDKRRLMPGQNWPRAIQNAIERADFFVPCFSEVAVGKKGQFPQELRIALRCADRLPLDDNFIIPVRFEECVVPARIQSAIQYVDLFGDWTGGVRRLTDAVWHEFGQRLSRY